MTYAVSPCKNGPYLIDGIRVDVYRFQLPEHRDEWLKRDKDRKPVRPTDVVETVSGKQKIKISDL